MFIYIILYLIASVGLFIYGFVNKSAKFNLFSYSLVLNIFPLIAISPMSMEEARLSGIPIGYLPMISAGLFLFFFNGLKIHKKDKTIFVLICIFLIYILIIAIIRGITVLTLIYWLMWVFNFMLLLTIINIFSKINQDRTILILKKIFLIFFMGSIVGIFRVIINIDTNSNFMPMFNRNGTVVMVVMLTPLIFYLLDNKKITSFLFWIIYTIIFICLILLKSRSGFIGFILLSLLYMLFSSKIQVWKILLLSTLTIGFLSSPLGELMQNRLLSIVKSIDIISSGSNIEAGKADYKRNMLILSSIEIIDNEFWFGTGVGLDNYRKAFHKYVKFYHHDSKPHNFYLSSFAEFGFIGFILLLLILKNIYNKLPKNRHFIAFKISFWGVAFMMFMNEYIGLPEIWFFFGMLIGTGYGIKTISKFDKDIK